MSLIRAGQLQEKTLSANMVNTRSIQPGCRPTINKADDEIIDAIESVQPVKAMAAMRHDYMKAVRKIFRGRVAVHWRRYRVPLTGENQGGYIRTGRFGVVVGNLCSRPDGARSEEHTSELQSRLHLVCRLLLEKKKSRSANNTPPAA